MYINATRIEEVIEKHNNPESLEMMKEIISNPGDLPMFPVYSMLARKALPGMTSLPLPDVTIKGTLGEVQEKIARYLDIEDMPGAVNITPESSKMGDYNAYGFIDHPWGTVRLEWENHIVEGIPCIKLDISAAIGFIEFSDLMVGMLRDLQMKPAKAKEEVDRDGEKNYRVDVISLSYENNELGAEQSKHMTDEFKDIRYELYPRINVPLMMDQYTHPDSANVLILVGPPGTGKTSLLRRAIADVAVRREHDITAVYIKNPDILVNDAVLNKIGKVNPDFLILDDMDEGLKCREVHGENPLMNKLLSFSNGAIKNNIKIIITTNRSIDNKGDIDGALVRRGRCFNVLKLPRLTYGEAMSAWIDAFNRPVEGFRELFRDETIEIDQATLAAEALLYGEFGGSDYLLDPTISVREQLAPDTVNVEKAAPAMMGKHQATLN
ncbi:hypothetical protein [Vibrio phage BONAISHI]|nr:hypothetical protein [Vibrio phage BONAISHI]